MGSELAERLLRWGTLGELVEAISESGPLIDRSIYTVSYTHLRAHET